MDRLACRGAADDIISESWESLSECLPHPESSEKHCGAAKELSEIYWSALQQLFGIVGKAFASSWGSLGDFTALPGYLLGAIGCLAGEDHPNLDARLCQKPTQAGDCVLRENTTKTQVYRRLL